MKHSTLQQILILALDVTQVLIAIPALATEVRTAYVTILASRCGVHSSNPWPDLQLPNMKMVTIPLVNNTTPESQNPFLSPQVFHFPAVPSTPFRAGTCPGCQIPGNWARDTTQDWTYPLRCSHTTWCSLHSSLITTPSPYQRKVCCLHRLKHVYGCLTFLV